MEKVMATYRIEYPDKGINQYKNLIGHEDYLRVIKPAVDLITGLEITMNKKNKEEWLKRIHGIKRDLKQQFSDNWFTDKSPLFEAIETGCVELLSYQGNHKCKIYKV